MTDISHQNKIARSQSQALSVAALIVFIVLLVRTAWISQYAYINFRIVENFTHGYGLTFNPGERALPLSQPAWPALLGVVYAAATNGLHLPSLNLLYGTTLLIQMIFSILALSILLRNSGGRYFGLSVALMFLFVSKSFIEYSTSGLENPLVHLLLAIFFVAYQRLGRAEDHRIRKDLTSLFLLGSAIIAVQWQWAALVGPVMIVVGRRERNRPHAKFASYLSIALLGAYYLLTYVSVGTFVPLQVLARLRAGVGLGRLIRQGLMYFMNMLDFDPLSILCAGFAVLGCRLFRKKSTYPFLVGMLLSGALITLLGGDFLGGRYFSPIVLTSAFLISQLDLPRSSGASVALSITFALGVFSARSPWMSDATYSYPDADHRGILDARGVDYAETGLLTLNRDAYYPSGSDWAGDDWVFTGYQGVAFLKEAGFGFQAYALGPNIYATTNTGLADPLLPRLPAKDRVIWDLDSLERQIPEGYPEGVLNGPEALRAPLDELYSDLRTLTRAPWFSRAHLSALWSVFSGDVPGL